MHRYIIAALHAGDGMDLFWQYVALWLSALTSATILPGTSEAGLAALVYTSPHAWLPALIVAMIGNVIGSMISYGMGRLLPDKYQPNERVQEKLQRFGPWMLVLAWVPIVGDALPIAAGWLRLNVWLSLLALLLGKAGRYAVVVWLALQAV